MINVKVDVKNLYVLEQQINLLNNLNKNLLEFLKPKFLEALEQVMNERLTGGSTNDEYIEFYKRSNQIVDIPNGFILYNDATIPINGELASKYPNGFSIALAFEYGTGVVGEGSYTGDYYKPWEYNINNYTFGWDYNKHGEKYHTFGYAGFEIYRYTVERIKENLGRWVKEFQFSQTKGGVKL